MTMVARDGMHDATLRIPMNGFDMSLPTTDERIQVLRRQVARRAQIVRQRTRLKNEIHSVLATHLIPRCASRRREPMVEFVRHANRVRMSAHRM
jgi:transposase